MRLNENLRQNDLKYCVSNLISIDEYVSKVDDDNITIAFFCNDMDIVVELRDFIEKAFFIEIKDIEIADTITEDNKYILFVEFERNIHFPKIMLEVLRSVSFLTDDKKWYFTTLNKHDSMECNEQNITKYVRLTKLKNTPQIDNEEVKESVDNVLLLQDNYGYCVRLINEGYITKNEMIKYIEKSEKYNELDLLTETLLKNKFGNKEIISTDDKIFIIDNDKILMLS